MTCISQGSRKFGLVCLMTALLTLPVPANDVSARSIDSFEALAPVPDYIAKKMARAAARLKPELIDMPACTRRLPRVQTGIASWYGPRFHGRKTSSGERYDMHQLTAAHRTLPLNTPVRVINQRNGESVILRINDRGPYVSGRVIDLSLAAAEALGMRDRGIARVKLEILCRPEAEQNILLTPPRKPAVI